MGKELPPAHPQALSQFLAGHLTAGQFAQRIGQGSRTLDAAGPVGQDAATLSLAAVAEIAPRRFTRRTVQLAAVVVGVAGAGVAAGVAIGSGAQPVAAASRPGAAHPLRSHRARIHRLSPPAAAQTRAATPVSLVPESPPATIRTSSRPARADRARRPKPGSAQPQRPAASGPTRSTPAAGTPTTPWSTTTATSTPTPTPTTPAPAGAGTTTGASTSVGGGSPGNSPAQ